MPSGPVPSLASWGQTSKSHLLFPWDIPSGPSSTEFKGSFFLLKGEQGSTFLPEPIQVSVPLIVPKRENLSLQKFGTARV